MLPNKQQKLNVHVLFTALILAVVAWPVAVTAQEIDDINVMDDPNLLAEAQMPGVVEGTVRVVFDPYRAQIASGEILVCPGTDPAWTPLFMAASGLVMEVGGMMTHGSVVAREYGIPAVVGVHQATQQLKDGQRIRLDGTNGRIVILPKE